jgi:hypothetical protein
VSAQLHYNFMNIRIRLRLQRRQISLARAIRRAVPLTTGVPLHPTLFFGFLIDSRNTATSPTLSTQKQSHVIRKDVLI